MVDEKDETTTTSPSEDELQGKVLVPKVGKEQEFLAAINEAAKIAHGKLGWRGQAEIFHEIGALPLMGVELDQVNTTKEEQLQIIEDYIKQSYLQTIMTYGEWITEEEADKRRKSTEVLFGDKDGG